MRNHHTWDWATVHRLALREARTILGAGPDAEDAAQEAAMRAWRRRATCRDAPGAWGRTIAHNEALRTAGAAPRRGTGRAHRRADRQAGARRANHDNKGGGGGG